MKIKFCKNLLWLACVLTSLTCVNAFSAPYGYASGHITQVAAGGVGTGAPSRNLVYFTMETSSAYADCANSNSPHFVVNADDGGQTMVSLLLASKLAVTTIKVVGRGTCNYIVGHEDVSLIYVD